MSTPLAAAVVPLLALLALSGRNRSRNRPAPAGAADPVLPRRPSPTEDPLAPFGDVPATPIISAANPEQPQLPMTLKQRAALLKIHLVQNQRNPRAFGYKGHPSKAVADFQRAAGIRSDGILGPETRAAARAVGVTLPPRPDTATAKDAPIVVDEGRKAAAVQLREYVLRTGDYGSRQKGSATVAKLQRAMGVKATGYAGPGTRKAAQALGVTIPRSRKEAQDTKAAKAKALAARGGAKRAAATRARVAKPTAREAYDALPLKGKAAVLRMFLVEHKRERAAFGYKGRPSQPVRDFQAAAGLAADGILGPRTRAKAKALGVDLPPRPDARPTTGEGGSAIKAIVTQLRDYLRANSRDVNAFGHRGYPSPNVVRAQQAMGIATDGIVGPNTYAAAERYGVELPLRPPMPKAYSAMTPGELKAANAGQAALKRAAERLRDFLRANPKAAAFGYKGRPSQPVRDFQGAAGLVADGILGPNTRSAAKAVGVTFPARPSR